MHFYDAILPSSNSFFSSFSCIPILTKITSIQCFMSPNSKVPLLMMFTRQHFLYFFIKIRFYWLSFIKNLIFTIRFI